jgi:hypothetical protein
MDYFAMLDMTLLHELCHAVGGQLHAIEHYGWKKVVSLAARSPVHAIQNAGEQTISLAF